MAAAKQFKIGSFQQEACAGGGGPACPLHPVERVLRARFQLQIPSVICPDCSNSTVSQPRLRRWSP